jgi:hypothetical protein
VHSDHNQQRCTVHASLQTITDSKGHVKIEHEHGWTPLLSPDGDVILTSVPKPEAKGIGFDANFGDADFGDAPFEAAFGDEVFQGEARSNSPPQPGRSPSSCLISTLRSTASPDRWSGLPPVAALDGELPAGWESAVSRSCGDTYYVNLVTGESTYDFPTEAAVMPEGEYSYEPPPQQEQEQGVQQPQSLEPEARGLAPPSWDEHPEIQSASPAVVASQVSPQARTSLGRARCSVERSAGR